MAVGVQKAWSPVAATNASSDSNANWAEGMLAPGINNSARANMAAIKAWANQIQGGCTYGGSANAYTITSDATGAISTAYANGMAFMLKANHTNTGAATLNVDGVGAVAIKTSDGGALAAGDIVSGGLYLLAYESATPSFQIVNTIAGGSYQPLDATLTAIAALDFSTAGSMMYSTAADTFSLLTTTAAGRTLLGLADPGADRLTFWDDSETSFAHLTLGTGLSISTTTLSLDAQLVDVAGLTPTDNGVIIGNGTNFVVESGATLKTSLGLTIGTDVQAWDADLDAIAALAKTDGNFIVGNGTTWVAESGSTVRSSLGLGTVATQNTGTSGTNVPLLDGANTWSAAQQVRTNGSTAAHSFGDDFVVGNESSQAGMTIFGPNNSLSSIFFGDADNSTVGRISYDHATDTMNLGAGGDSSDLAITTSTITFDGVAIPTISSTDTLSNKTLSGPTLSGSVAGTPTISSAWTWSTAQNFPTNSQVNSSNIVTLAASQTLTSKTLTSPTINGGTSSAAAQVSSETTGTLTSASDNKQVNMTGDCTINDGVHAANCRIEFYAGASARTLTQDTGMTIRLDGTATTGNRSIPARGRLSLFFVSNSEAVASGMGVT